MVRQKIVIVDDKYYSLKGNTPPEVLRSMRKFRGYDIEFIRQQDTNLYEFYHFKTRKEESK